MSEQVVVSPRVLGRTGVPVPFQWRMISPGIYGQGDWCVLETTPDALARRGDPVVVNHLAAAGRGACDLLLVRGLLSNDLKVGWPMHRLQQMRDRGLCRYFAVEAENALEAEWIAANAPVHAVVIAFDPTDMSARYRAFAAAENSGVALIARAPDAQTLAFHAATPEITASISDAVFDAAATDVEAAWQRYAAEKAEPAKLRSGHPPDHGV
ncbi:MAG TPA: hypothetical protein VGB55_13250 [Tepidisphaeraceae bacterium]|jgi:hypothetical protein